MEIMPKFSNNSVWQLILALAMLAIGAYVQICICNGNL